MKAQPILYHKCHKSLAIDISWEEYYETIHLLVFIAFSQEWVFC
jgi:hypothetical protein